MRGFLLLSNFVLLCNKITLSTQVIRKFQMIYLLIVLILISFVFLFRHNFCLLFIFTLPFARLLILPYFKINVHIHTSHVLVDLYFIEFCFAMLCNRFVLRMMEKVLCALCIKTKYCSILIYLAKILIFFNSRRIENKFW